jgi:hypothetical protein
MDIGQEKPRPVELKCLKEEFSKGEKNCPFKNASSKKFGAS